MTDSDEQFGRKELVRGFINLLPSIPALLLDRHLDVLASSPLARAIAPGLTVGANVVRLGVIAATRGPEAHGLQVDLAGLLRDGVARFQEDERYVAVIGELVATSRGFARAWVGGQPPRRAGVLELRNAAVGSLRLEYVRLPIEETAGETLVLARPSDAETDRRLRRLGEAL